MRSGAQNSFDHFLKSDQWREVNARDNFRVSNITEADTKGSKVVSDNLSRTTERSQKDTLSLPTGLTCLALHKTRGCFPKEAQTIGMWLVEIAALRVAVGKPADRHYGGIPALYQAAQASSPWWFM